MVPGGDDEHYLKHHDGDDHQHQNTLNDATMKQVMMEKKKVRHIFHCSHHGFCFVHDDDDTEDELVSYVC